MQEEPSSKKKEKSAKSRASTSKAKGADDEDIDEAQAGDKPLTESEIQEKRKKTGKVGIAIGNFILMLH